MVDQGTNPGTDGTSADGLCPTDGSQRGVCSPNGGAPTDAGPLVQELGAGEIIGKFGSILVTQATAIPFQPGMQHFLPRTMMENSNEEKCLGFLGVDVRKGAMSVICIDMWGKLCLSTFLPLVILLDLYCALKTAQAASQPCGAMPILKKA